MKSYCALTHPAPAISERDGPIQVTDCRVIGNTETHIVHHSLARTGGGDPGLLNKWKLATGVGQARIRILSGSEVLEADYTHEN